MLFYSSFAGSPIHLLGALGGRTGSTDVEQGQASEGEGVLEEEGAVEEVDDVGGHHSECN